MNIPPRFKLLAVIAFISACIMLPLMQGCEAMDVQQSIDQARSVQQLIEAKSAEKIADLEAQKEFADAEARAEIERLQAEIARGAAVARESIDEGIAVVSRVVTPEGEITPDSVAPVVAAYLTWPWNLAALVGVPLVAAGVQEWRKRQAEAALRRQVALEEARAAQIEDDALSIVNSIDQLRIEKPEVKAMMSEVKDRMHLQLTPGALDLIHAESLT